MTIPDLLDQLRFSRFYTNRLLDQTPMDLWPRVPPGGVSHIAWQVGHLAMAGYRLALERVRGPLPDDSSLISADFLALFGRDSVPNPDPAAYPPGEEMRAIFDRVHARILVELPATREDDLELPPLKPHPLCATRRECVLWCAAHEMLHAGQIGLLRRQLGLRPIW